MMPEPRTLREVIQAGKRGDFARHLLRAYEVVHFGDLRIAYKYADENHREAIKRAVGRWLDQEGFRTALRIEFSGLACLDARPNDPESIPIRTPRGEA